MKLSGHRWDNRVSDQGATAVLFLDSAFEADALEAREMGWVRGITTNPRLMDDICRHWEEQLALLLDVFPIGPVFIQPSPPEEAEPQLDRAYEIGGTRVIAKLPAQLAMFSLGARLADAGRQVAFTAVYSPAQAVIAAASGARWVIPYVDRAARLRPDIPVIPALREALDALESPAGLLAASLKTPEQVVAAFAQGADAATVPLAVLRAMAHDALTDQAVDEAPRLPAAGDPSP
jgi:transaldolase